MSSDVLPQVTVLVPTFRGGDLAGRCIASILACDYPHFDVIAIDQTPEHEPWMLAEPHPRFRLVHLERQGKSSALNHGLSLTTAEVVAFTDQDCIVPADWLSEGVRQLRESGAGLLFASVDAPAHDRRVELIPDHRIPRFEVVRGRFATARLCGLGANMFALRSVLERLGGFDETLGPGHIFPCGEDQDLWNRALRAGIACARAPEPTILHLGARSVASGEAAAHLREYSLGIGALASKDLRLGDFAAMYHPLREVGSEARGHVSHLLHSRTRHRQVVRFPHLARGFVRGLRTALDRDRKVMRAGD